MYQNMFFFNRCQDVRTCACKMLFLKWTVCGLYQRKINFRTFFRIEHELFSGRAISNRDKPRTSNILEQMKYLLVLCEDSSFPLWLVRNSLLLLPPSHTLLYYTDRGSRLLYITYMVFNSRMEWIFHSIIYQRFKWGNLNACYLFR